MQVIYTQRQVLGKSSSKLSTMGAVASIFNNSPPDEEQLIMLRIASTLKPQGTDYIHNLASLSGVSRQPSEYEELCRGFLNDKSKFSISAVISKSFTPDTMSLSEKTCSWISKDTMRIIMYSWYDLKCCRLLQGKGTNLLKEEVILYLSSLEGGSEVCTLLFRSKKNNLIANMANYLVHLKPNDSREFKFKIRALGRSHARLGVTEDMIRIFNESFLHALMRVFVRTNFSFRESVQIVSAWRKLLQFIVDQMTFDKIKFISHGSLPGTKDVVFEDTPSYAGVSGELADNSAASNSATAAAAAAAAMAELAGYDSEEEAHRVDSDIAAQEELIEAQRAEEVKGQAGNRLLLLQQEMSSLQDTTVRMSQLRDGKSEDMQMVLQDIDNDNVDI